MSLPIAGLRLEAINVPQGLDFAVVLRHEKNSQGRVLLILQGLTEGRIVREEATGWISVRELRESPDPTGLLQQAVDRLYQQLRRLPAPIRLLS